MSQIKVNSIIPVSGVPTGGGGGIVQILTSTKVDTFTTTSSTYADVSGLSVSITPTSTSNKIYIVVTVHNGGEGGSYCGYRVLRDSTIVTQGTHATGNRSNVTFGGRIDQPYESMMNSFNFLDSPATTSATTYKVQMSSLFASRMVTLNRTNDDANETYSMSGTCTITVMEVSA